MPEQKLTTSCCIAGGGPAGMMLGFLLARAGVEVILLEKHADFFRDFRGDTIHASTFQSMDELGLLDEFLQVPHDEQKTVQIEIGNKSYPVADFSHLPVPHRVLGFMPQWDFLDFIKRQAQRYQTFHLMMNAQATDVIQANGQVSGLQVKTPDGIISISAKLIVGADGRRSVVREKAGLIVEKLGAPIDVLWFRISRHAGDPPQPLLHILNGRVFVTAVRKNYFQCGYIIPKGSLADLQQKGLDSFRNELAALLPFAGDRVTELKSWDDVKLLSVTVDRLKQWFLPGLLCIGDAAHAMSPVGGVGINLAIQDAVAAANILWKPLVNNEKPDAALLEKVQRRREPPTKKTQSLQVFIQNKVLFQTIAGKKSSTPFIFQLTSHLPLLQRLPARFFGLGFQPEHILTPDVLRKN